MGIDQSINLAEDLLKDPGLAGNFGMRGAVPNTPGSDAANAAAKMDRFIAVSGLQGVADLKTKGINLYPMSNTDLGAVQKGVVNLNKMQDVDSAKAALQQYVDVARKAKDEGAKNYERTRSLYDLNTSSPPTASSKPVPITDDAGYNALPSGTQFTGPDGVLRRKP